jgi:hypothetical protein
LKPKARKKLRTLSHETTFVVNDLLDMHWLKRWSPE